MTLPAPVIRGFAVCVFALPHWLASSIEAQDFRVYTAVTQMGPDAASQRVVARSLTLFHAGRVYDHMEEVGELVIFEPVRDRFILIRDHVGTEVSLDELRTMLGSAKVAARRYALDLQTHSDTDARKASAQLLFQLEPEFTNTVDDEARSLQLVGSELRYRVQGAEPPAADLLQSYVTYANWAARLNAVLHSQGTFPGPRESLNAALLEHQVLPVSVTLEARDPRDLHLRADHEYRWGLQAIDRDLIHRWEQLRESDRMQWVSFREYQHRLLAAAERTGH